MRTVLLSHVLLNLLGVLLLIALHELSFLPLKSFDLTAKCLKEIRDEVTFNRKTLNKGIDTLSSAELAVAPPEPPALERSCSISRCNAASRSHFSLANKNQFNDRQRTKIG